MSAMEPSAEAREVAIGGPLMRLAALLIAIATVGSAVWSLLPRRGFDFDFVIGVTAFAIGVVTFFRIAALQRGTLDGDRLRTAIACALVMTYLYMVCFTTFVANALQVGAVTRAFVESFASVIGVTIAFYFGATAAVQIFGRRPRDRDRDR